MVISMLGDFCWFFFVHPSEWIFFCFVLLNTFYPYSVHLIQILFAKKTHKHNNNLFKKWLWVAFVFLFLFLTYIIFPDHTVHCFLFHICRFFSISYLFRFFCHTRQIIKPLQDFCSQIRKHSIIQNQLYFIIWILWKLQRNRYF